MVILNLVIFLLCLSFLKIRLIATRPLFMCLLHHFIDIPEPRSHIHFGSYVNVVFISALSNHKKLYFLSHIVLRLFDRFSFSTTQNNCLNSNNKNKKFIMNNSKFRNGLLLYCLHET